MPKKRHVLMPKLTTMKHTTRQSRISNVVLVLPLGESCWAYALFASPMSAPVGLCETWCRSQNWKYITYCSAVRGSRAIQCTPQEGCSQNTVKPGRVIFEIRERTDGHRNGETCRHSTRWWSQNCSSHGAIIQIQSNIAKKAAQFGLKYWRAHLDRLV